MMAHNCFTDFAYLAQIQSMEFLEVSRMLKNTAQVFLKDVVLINLVFKLLMPILLDVFAFVSFPAQAFAVSLVSL